MSERHFTDAPWKALARKLKIDDSGLAKALADYDRTAEEDRAARLEAIEEVKAKAKKVKKENAKNKEATDYLDEVLAEAEKLRKAIENTDPGGGKEEGDQEAAE